MEHQGAGISEVHVLAAIQRIGEARLGVSRVIEPTDDLTRDLDLDSVQLITMAIEIEDHFKIALPLDSRPRIKTVADLCRIVVERLRTRQ